MGCVNHVFEADIRGYFNHVCHSWVQRMVRERIADQVILSLIGKWLKAGAMKDGVVLRSEEGTPQGGPISCILANIYLHFSLDLAKFALSLHPEKTRLIEFGRFAAERRAVRGERKPKTFDFPSFTHICGKKRNGWGFSTQAQESAQATLEFCPRIGEELDERRHEPVNVQGRRLQSVLRGYYAYFAVPQNIAAVRNVRHHIKIRWYLSLGRRSQRTRLSWRRMNVVAAKYPPMPTVLHPWPEQRFLVKHPR